MANPNLTNLPLSPTPAPAHDTRTEPDITAAAARITAEVDAMPDDDLESINRDVDTVATTVYGVLRQLPTHLPALAALPGLDLARLKKLGDYTDGLVYWNASATYAQPPKPELNSMVEKAYVMRTRMLADLKALAKHGVLDESLIEDFGGSPAYRKVAHDLIGLSNLVHARWSDIAGKSLLTLAAMDEASTLGKSILQAVGDRDIVTAEIARDVVRRNKAYTLVIRTYGELRDALAFLRRKENDVEKIAPSLFALGKTGKKNPDEAEAPASASRTTPTATPTLAPQHSSLIVPDDAPIGPHG